MTTSPPGTEMLGTTDMAITRIGFGAWAIGGGGWRYAWGPQDDGEAVAAIVEAVDAGINWIDTAAVYGLGHSEEVVGQALRTIPEPDRPFVFTKCGRIWVDDDPYAEPRSVATRSSLTREVDGSLRRLGVDRIDLYQVHHPPEDDTSIDEYWGTLLHFVEVGKVRAIGLSNHSVAQIQRAEVIGHVDCVQPPLSVIDRAVAADILPWCKANGTGVIVYSPLQSGLLTGKYDRPAVNALPADDWRRGSVDFTVDLDKNLLVVDVLREIAADHGVTPSVVAVAWTLAWPGVTGAIVGARSAAQVRAWANATDVTLTNDDLGRIADTVRTSGAGSGPDMPADIK